MSWWNESAVTLFSIINIFSYTFCLLFAASVWLLKKTESWQFDNYQIPHLFESLVTFPYVSFQKLERLQFFWNCFGQQYYSPGYCGLSLNVTEEESVHAHRKMVIGFSRAAFSTVLMRSSSLKKRHYIQKIKPLTYTGEMCSWDVWISVILMVFVSLLNFQISRFPWHHC